MYFWNVKKLSAELSKGTLEDKLKFYYFLIGCLLTHFSTFIPRELNGQELILQAGLTTIAHCVGILFCYKANQRGDGRNFVERIVCLMLPTTFRFAVFFGIPSSFIPYDKMTSVEAAPFVILVDLAGLVVLYLMMGKYILQTSQAASQKTLETLD